MDDEKLISLVQERDELYNKHNPLFKSVEKKAEAWMNIGAEMEMSAEDCMRRWSNLRERFTRENKRIYLSNYKNKSSWTFFEMMQFLKPFVTRRPSKYKMTSVKVSDVLKQKSNQFSNGSPTLSSIYGPTYAKDSETTRTLPTYNNSSTPIQIELLKQQQPSPTSSITPSPTPSIPHSPTPSIPLSPEETAMEISDYAQVKNDPLTELSLSQKKTYNSNPEVDKSFCEAVEALKRVCALNEVRHKNPAVHAFGEMIVSTICSMNSRNQLKAMQQVTDTVMRIKIQEDELSEGVA